MPPTSTLNSSSEEPSSKQREAELIARLAHGDEQGFEQLIRAHGGYLMTVARRYLGSEADVQDCIQETFLTAFEKISSFEHRSSLRSWLHRITVNRALSKLRTQSRRPEQLLEDTASLFDERGKRISTPDEISNSAEAELSNQRDLEEIRGIIEQMPETSRNLLLLRDVEGYSTEETSKLLGVSIAAVKTGLHRARHALKMRIED